MNTENDFGVSWGAKAGNESIVQPHQPFTIPAL